MGAVSLVLIVSGCDESRSGEQQARANSASPTGRTTHCKLLGHGDSPRDSPPRKARLNKPFRLTLPSARESRISIVVTGARLVSSVRDRYGEAGAFTAPRRFVAVHYKLRNLGPAVVEPAAHVNRQFGLTGTTSGIVLSVDRVNGCGAAPSSYARRVGRDNPEEGQKPGQNSETVALYAIAGSTKRMAWTAPGLHVKVHLGDVDASARGAARPPARGEIHGR